MRKNNNTTVRKLYIAANINYKVKCREKESKYLENIGNKLEETKPNSKDWWNIIRELKEENNLKGNQIHINEFYTYFRQLLNPKPTAAQITFVQNYIEDEQLDKDLDIEELNIVLDQLKDGKSPGSIAIRILQIYN